MTFHLQPVPLGRGLALPPSESVFRKPVCPCALICVLDPLPVTAPPSSLTPPPPPKMHCTVPRRVISTRKAVPTSLTHLGGCESICYLRIVCVWDPCFLPVWHALLHFSLPPPQRSASRINSTLRHNVITQIQDAPAHKRPHFLGHTLRIG